MASYQNSAKLTFDLPWKTFVTETPKGDLTEKSTDKCVRQLGFEGNEAKIAYEEIIQQSEDNDSKKHNNIPLRLKTAENVQNKNKNHENLTKVNVNAILKAVEQHDLKFLQNHVTSENVNISDDFGWTPLMSAAYCGYLEIVEFLLTLGANKRMREKSGLTAAQLALKKNYLSTVALLRKKHDYPNNKCSSTAEAQNVNTSALSEEVSPLRDQKDSLHNGINNSKEQLSQNLGFYCEICKEYFREATLKKHESSTLHVFNTKPKLKSAFYGISKQNKGYQMLLNTGWDEEGGLGPSGKGIKYPIKTLLKIDRKGIGQPGEKEPRVTHFKPGDTSAVSSIRIAKQKPMKKKDREKLLNREARKERVLRIALS